MKRVTIYARVSTREQSPEMQILDLRSYAGARSFTIVNEYVDYASGGRSDRTNYQKLLDDVRKRRTDAVLVWKFDRFASWADVDLQHRLLHVRSTDKFKTKTSNSERTIPMTKDLCKLLKQLEVNKKSDLVFTTTSGTQIKERKALAICKDVAEKAKISSNAFLHKFRHKYAKILIQRGERLEDIKELLGYSSITETEIYAHHKPDQLHDKVTHLDNLIDLAKKGQS